MRKNKGVSTFNFTKHFEREERKRGRVEEGKEANIVDWFASSTVLTLYARSSWRKTSKGKGGG